MLDREAVVEHALRGGEQAVGRFDTRHDEMRGQGGLGGAQGPDMEVVHSRDPTQRCERLLDFCVERIVRDMTWIKELAVNRATVSI